MKAIILLLIFSMALPLHAEPVGEMELLVMATKQLEELRNQYRMMKNNYQNATEQLDNIKQLKQMNSGHYRFGDFENGLDQLKSWQSPTNTWDDALKNLSGGNAERYDSLVKAYEANHPTLTTQFMSGNNAVRFKEDKAVNRTVQAQTTAAYNEINQRLAALHRLSKLIEKTDNTKGAIDLNSRLITELGFIQLMSVRLQTLMSQQLSQDSLNELQERVEMARFNQVG